VDVVGARLVGFRRSLPYLFHSLLTGGRKLILVLLEALYEASSAGLYVLAELLSIVGAGPR
jgi:hypothetical protein